MEILRTSPGVRSQSFPRGQMLRNKTLCANDTTMCEDRLGGMTDQESLAESCRHCGRPVILATIQRRALKGGPASCVPVLAVVHADMVGIPGADDVDSLCTRDPAKPTLPGRDGGSRSGQGKSDRKR